MALRRSIVLVLACVAASLALNLAAGCATDGDHEPLDTVGAPTEPAPPNAGTFGGDASPAAQCRQCSADLHGVVDCSGAPVETCTGASACDAKTGACANACEIARVTKQSVGCDYYATDMETAMGENGFCFAAIVANTWSAPAHITAQRAGTPLAIEAFTRIPSGAGASLTYAPYSASKGLAPGEVAILFLDGQQGPAPRCPAPAAIPWGGMVVGTSGIGGSFHIETDVPVVAYQINPYGGGSAAVTGASLLLPTSAWDTNYVVVDAYGFDPTNPSTHPSFDVVAMENGTTVTMIPTVPVEGGGGLPGGLANAALAFTLNKGEFAQFSQAAELTGSVLQSDKPVGLMAGHSCMNVPKGVSYCDHAEQMIPPVRALGSEYVGVMYRPRKGEPGIWRVIGAVNGTALTWSTPVGGPATLESGQIAELTTDQPFVVKSQDASHPFVLLAYMSGSAWQPGLLDYGDPDVVLSVPPQQYLRDYVFFVDPTYPEANVVVVRAKANGKFEDVALDCAGTLGGWQSIGDYEWTRADLVTGDFAPVGACSSGRHEMKSKARFGLWVWGWGTPSTKTFTANVSYGYPAGMNVEPINNVVVPAVPR